MSRAPTPPASGRLLQQLSDRERRDEFVADTVHTYIAQLIRTLREVRGWSQDELARRIGMSQSVISKLENPDHGRVMVQTLLKIAAAFDLPLLVDMPGWGEWFADTAKVPTKGLRRVGFAEFVAQQPDAAADDSK